MYIEDGVSRQEIISLTMLLRKSQCVLFTSVALFILFSCNRSKVQVEPDILYGIDLFRYTISTSVGSLGGTITDSQKISKGKPVSITAYPNEHYRLKEWKGNCGTFNIDNVTITFEVSNHCTVTAIFEKIIYTIIANSKGGVV